MTSGYGICHIRGVFNNPLMTNFRISIILRKSKVDKLFAYFDISPKGGNLCYRMSQSTFVNRTKFERDKKTDIKTLPTKIDHITIHKDGSIQFRPKKGNSELNFKFDEKRPSLKETGQIHLLTDFLRSWDELPPTKMLHPSVRTILFDLTDYSAVFIRYELFSSHNIINNDFDKLGKKDERGEFITSENFALGYESGYQDKMIFVGLYKNFMPMKEGRGIFISDTSGRKISYINL